MLSTTTHDYQFKNLNQVEYFLTVITELVPAEYQTEYSVEDLKVEVDVPNVLEDLYDATFLAARKIAA